MDFLVHVIDGGRAEVGDRTLHTTETVFVKDGDCVTYYLPTGQIVGYYTFTAYNGKLYATWHEAHRLGQSYF